jgi:hypothetical protein
MKLHGYPNEGLPAEEVIPAELAEITLVATPLELCRLSEFLTFCASEMERMGKSFDHVHLSDHMKSFRNSPHFVVMRSTNDKKLC